MTQEPRAPGPAFGVRAPWAFYFCVLSSGARAIAIDYTSLFYVIQGAADFGAGPIQRGHLVSAQTPTQGSGIILYMPRTRRAWNRERPLADQPVERNLSWCLAVRIPDPPRQIDERPKILVK